MSWHGIHILPMRRNNFLRIAQRCMTTLFVLWSLSPVSGKDLNILTRILYAAFAAEQMAAICISANIPLSDDDKNVFTSAKVYADGIKQLVIARLADSDVSFVLTSAADRARADTKVEIEVLAKYPSERIPAETLRWCENRVMPFANQIVGAYVRNPDEIRQLITKGKTD